MRRSIKIMAGIRVVAALLAVLLFSLLTTQSIFNLEATEEENASVNVLLQRAQMAEAAHYKWSSNLSNALYSGSEFTGSTDPTGCVLGQWLYGEAGTDDKTILDLRSQLEPLHKELHESAIYVLELYAADPAQAQAYYQDTIMSNLGVLVGLLEEVVERGTELNEVSMANMEQTMSTMHIVTGVGLILTLVFLLSLVIYIMSKVVKPILVITNKAKPLQEGRMKLDMQYNAKDELGDLSRTLRQSMEQTHQYIEDINRMMEELSAGNFDVSTSVPFIGDFQSIAESVDSFTDSLSTVMANIRGVADTVYEHARTLSNGSQMLAQGATEQAAAVEELSATLDELARSAKQNIQKSSEVRENAHITGEQVNLSSQQMELLVNAMSDISTTSEQIENIISTIENIAFQTNILALNAAVEAARAGTNGKGFAVVAEEVRNLATKSDQAAKATKELIERSVNAVESGSLVVGKVTDSVTAAVKMADEAAGQMEQVTKAVEDQTDAIEQVASGIEQISGVVQNNSATAEESAATSQELSGQAAMLQQLVGGFRLLKK